MMRLRWIALSMFVIGFTFSGLLPWLVLGVSARVAFVFGLALGLAMGFVMYLAWRIDQRRLREAGYRW